ncbi:MAG: DUF4231 domain-containing protein [Planctomycetota bacterium]|jgi:hypothetical protein
MAEQPPDFDSRKNSAMKRFRETLDWYEKARVRSRWLYYVCQSAVIILSGVTPLLLLLESTPKVIPAIPPAMASVLAGLMGIYKFHEQWIRRSVTAEALKSESAKYETRSGDSYGMNLPADRALENFVLIVEQIEANSVAEWQQLRVERAPDKKHEDAT